VCCAARCAGWRPCLVRWLAMRRSGCRQSSPRRCRLTMKRRRGVVVLGNQRNVSLREDQTQVARPIQDLSAATTGGHRLLQFHKKITGCAMVHPARAKTTRSKIRCHRDCPAQGLKTASDVGCARQTTADPGSDPGKHCRLRYETESVPGLAGGLGVPAGSSVREVRYTLQLPASWDIRLHGSTIRSQNPPIRGQSMAVGGQRCEAIRRSRTCLQSEAVAGQMIVSFFPPGGPSPMASQLQEWATGTST